MPVFLLQEGSKCIEQSALEGALRANIPGLVELNSLERLLKSSAKLEQDDPAIVVVSLPRNDRDFFEHLVDLAAQQGNAPFLVLIGDEISASDYKRLI